MSFAMHVYVNLPVLCSQSTTNNEYYTRPTPHQVWQSEQDAKFKFKDREVIFSYCLNICEFLTDDIAHLTISDKAHV